MKPILVRRNRGKSVKSLPRNLRYGRTYVIAFAGTSESIEFTLKKKKRIAFEWTDGSVTHESMNWLRKLVRNPDFVHFMFETEGVKLN